MDGRIKVLVGNIVEQDVDVIVNAANSGLMGGGGVDGAIHRAAGPQILEECREIRRTKFPKGLPTGLAVITTGGNLPAKYVIHTVGPVYGVRQQESPELLAACYRNSLSLAVENNLQSIAFPSISTGAFHYPREDAARISSEAINNYLLADDTLKEVRLVFFSLSDAKVLLKNHNFRHSGQ
ncbi:MAG TPA: O-acetyl-ADP-ribose deacetylase [Blastocatellia bacterium]|nr:O-acetyl-ADP-ribose deacetylase [Blastocatellia bacterium]